MEKNWSMEDTKRYMMQWIEKECDWSNLIKVYAVMHTLEEMQENNRVNPYNGEKEQNSSQYKVKNADVWKYAILPENF